MKKYIAYFSLLFVAFATMPTVSFGLDCADTVRTNASMKWSFGKAVTFRNMASKEELMVEDDAESFKKFKNRATELLNQYVKEQLESPLSGKMEGKCSGYSYNCAAGTIFKECAPEGAYVCKKTLLASQAEDDAGEEYEDFMVKKICSLSEADQKAIQDERNFQKSGMVRAEENINDHPTSTSSNKADNKTTNAKQSRARASANGKPSGTRSAHSTTGIDDETIKNEIKKVQNCNRAWASPTVKPGSECSVNYNLIDNEKVAPEINKLIIDNCLNRKGDKKGISDNITKFKSVPTHIGSNMVYKCLAEICKGNLVPDSTETKCVEQTSPTKDESQKPSIQDDMTKGNEQNTEQSGANDTNEAPTPTNDLEKEMAADIDQLTQVFNEIVKQLTEDCVKSGGKIVNGECVNQNNNNEQVKN